MNTLSSQKNPQDILYTDLINPEIYNQILSEQHIYIAQSDKACIEFIYARSNLTDLEIVELGCGPARILRQLDKIKESSNITGVDIDQKFLSYAQSSLVNFPRKINLIQADISTYFHPKAVDLFFSVGVHHHVSKGKKTNLYLANVHKQLKKDGIYIVADEFVPEYETETERELRIAIWYSHVIAHALKYNYNYLANEESKIFLDDLLESKTSQNYKTQEQIDYVLQNVTEINNFAINGDAINANKKATEFLNFLNQHFNSCPSNQFALDASRRDYKICPSVFKKEIETAGFKITDEKIFGNIDNIGAMCMYVLSKR